MREGFFFFLASAAAVVAMLAMVAAVTGFYAAIAYAAWNLALAPWLGWREMPVSVALVVGLVVVLLTVRVRRS